MKDIQVKLSEDGRVGLLTVEAPPESYPTADEIKAQIKSAEWPLEINQTLLEKLVTDHRVTHDQIITEIDYNDDSFIWYIEEPFKLTTQKDEEGRVDFKQKKEFQTVKEGQELVSVIPPDDLESGSQSSHTILYYLSGKNTRISEDGLTLYASRDGYVFFRENKIIVDNVYYIDGDVNFKTGNVKFDGVILIEGDVRSGFRVDATESLIVNGMVEAASLYSRNGDITIKHGIMGQDRAKILSGGNIKCTFIQNANVSARKDITVEKYILNSVVQSGGAISVNTAEGLIRGGKVLAEDRIDVRVVGGERGTPTEIGLTGFENVSIDSRRKSLRTEYTGLQKRLSSLEKQVEFFHLLKERFDNLTQKKENKLSNAQEEIEVVKAELTKLEDQLSTLDEKGTSANRSKCINILDTVYHGVTITMGTIQDYVAIAEKAVQYYRKSNAIGKEGLD